MSAQAVKVVRLETAIEKALEELGVPQPGYPAPVANAVNILSAALHTEIVRTSANEAERRDLVDDIEKVVASGLDDGLKLRCIRQLVEDALR